MRRCISERSVRCAPSSLFSWKYSENETARQATGALAASRAPPPALGGARLGPQAHRPWPVSGLVSAYWAGLVSWHGTPYVRPVRDNHIQDIAGKATQYRIIATRCSRITVKLQSFVFTQSSESTGHIHSSSAGGRLAPKPRPGLLHAAPHLQHNAAQRSVGWTRTSALGLLSGQDLPTLAL